MNKKLVILIPVIILVAIAAILVFNIKKGKVSLSIQSANLSASVPLVNQAKDLEAKGDLLGAKGVYQKLVSDFPNSPEVMNWQKKIEGINISLLFSSVITPKSVLYEIKPGDTLTKIAKEHKTTTELIKKSNNLTSDAIMP